MIYQFSQVPLVEALYPLPPVYPAHHVREHQLLLSRVHQRIPGDQYLQRVQQGCGSRSGGQRVDNHPEDGRAGPVSDHLEALELDGSIESLADEVDPGRLVETREALFALDVAQGREERLVLVLGTVHLVRAMRTWMRVRTVSTGR